MSTDTAHALAAFNLAVLIGCVLVFILCIA